MYINKKITVCNDASQKILVYDKLLMSYGSGRGLSVGALQAMANDGVCVYVQSLVMLHLFRSFCYRPLPLPHPPFASPFN